MEIARALAVLGCSGGAARLNGEKDAPNAGESVQCLLKAHRLLRSRLQKEVAAEIRFYQTLGRAFL